MKRLSFSYRLTTGPRHSSFWKQRNSGGVEINGTGLFLDGEQLVNEDFGTWPFEDELA